MYSNMLYAYRSKQTNTIKCLVIFFFGILKKYMVVLDKMSTKPKIPKSTCNLCTFRQGENSMGNPDL